MCFILLFVAYILALEIFLLKVLIESQIHAIVVYRTSRHKVGVQNVTSCRFTDVRFEKLLQNFCLKLGNQYLEIVLNFSGILGQFSIYPVF